jgi:hypothetical protein
MAKIFIKSAGATARPMSADKPVIVMIALAFYTPPAGREAVW